MNNKLPPETMVELIRLRNILDKISQISWSFSTLNKSYPISEITFDDAQVIKEEYLDLIEEARSLVFNGDEQPT